MNSTVTRQLRENNKEILDMSLEHSNQEINDVRISVGELISKVDKALLMKFFQKNVPEDILYVSDIEHSNIVDDPEKIKNQIKQFLFEDFGIQLHRLYQLKDKRNDVVHRKINTKDLLPKINNAYEEKILREHARKLLTLYEGLLLEDKDYFT